MKGLSKIVSVIFLLGLVYSCSGPQQEKTSTEQETPEEAPLTQSAALAARQARSAKKAKPETTKIYSEALEAIVSSGILESAKNVGDMAPDFTLKNAVGKEVSLQEYLNKGPVVLVWYRGSWCPYCNINLHYLQQELPNIQAQGAQLLALTPELPDQSISSVEKHQLTFEVLSDIGNTVAKKYGIVYTLTDEVAARYNASFDLNSHNGDTSNELPLAATYIITSDGKIANAFIDADYKKRAEPSELTAFLKNMKKE